MWRRGFGETAGEGWEDVENEEVENGDGMEEEEEERETSWRRTLQEFLRDGRACLGRVCKAILRECQSVTARHGKENS